MAVSTDAVDRAIDEITGVPTDDGRIEVFAHGGASMVAERRGDAASARTVVLVHGIGMGRKVFGDLGQHLDGEALVVALDLPGYGDAPEPTRTPTIERMADLAAAYLRHLGRGLVVLLGHSMGPQADTETVAPTVDRHRRRALHQVWHSARDLWARARRCCCSAPASTCGRDRT